MKTFSSNMKIMEKKDYCVHYVISLKLFKLKSWSQSCCNEVLLQPGNPVDCVLGKICFFSLSESHLKGFFEADLKFPVVNIVLKIPSTLSPRANQHFRLQLSDFHISVGCW